MMTERPGAHHNPVTLTWAYRITLDASPQQRRDTCSLACVLVTYVGMDGLMHQHSHSGAPHCEAAARHARAPADARRVRARTRGTLMHQPTTHSTNV
jgi:hypothetical protein